MIKMTTMIWKIMLWNKKASLHNSLGLNLQNNWSQWIKLNHHQCEIVIKNHSHSNPYFLLWWIKTKTKLINYSINLKRLPSSPLSLQILNNKNMRKIFYLIINFIIRINKIKEITQSSLNKVKNKTFNRTFNKTK